jgi:splicing factor 3B subunit 2
MGKIDIDYSILHDAFFKHQKRPDLSMHGDIYFEGRECEIKKNNLKPGRISATLSDALGITDSSAPPWIMNM